MAVELVIREAVDAAAYLERMPGLRVDDEDDVFRQPDNVYRPT